MDSTAGESSPAGRGVGGLLAGLHGVGRAQGFLSQHPTRCLAWGPLPAGSPDPCPGAKGPLLVPTAPTSPQKPGSIRQRAKGATLGCKGHPKWEHSDELPGRSPQPQPSLPQPLRAGRQPGDPRVPLPILSGCWILPRRVTIQGAREPSPGLASHSPMWPLPTLPVPAQAASEEQGSAENNPQRATWLFC